MAFIGKFLSFFLKEGSAAILAIALAIFFFYFKVYEPPADATGLAVFIAAAVLIFYGFLQGLAAVFQPAGEDTRPMVDLFFSSLPALVSLYTLVQYLVGYEELSTFQLEVLVLSLLVVTHDLVINTKFVMKINRLASDFVSMR